MQTSQRLILLNLTTCFLYFIAAKLGLLLAIPPGFASAMWPAAGVALALVLVWGRGILPGVFIGSTLANLTVVQSISSASMLFAILLGTGAMLQAAFGYKLLNKQIRSGEWLVSISRIRLFLLKAGPLSCLVSASVGALSLLSFSYINIVDVPFTWFTWWVGDLLGSLFVGPITLVIFNRHKLKLHKKLYQVITPSIMVLALVIIVFAFNRAEQSQVPQQALLKESNQVATALVNEIARYQAYARAYSGLFASQKHISQQEFDDFSQQVILQQDAIFAVAWMPKLPRSNKQDFLAKMRESQENFHIQTIDYSVLPHIYPITYIYPDSPFISRMLGLDLGSEQLRSHALIRAEKLAKSTITAPILFQYQQGAEPAFFIFTPIIENQLVTGHCVLIIPSSQLLTNLLERYLNEHASVEYKVDLTTNNGVVLFQQSPEKNVDILQVEQINILDQVWQLQIGTSSSEFIAKKDWSSWLILVVGVVLTIMLQTFILWLTSSHTFVERQVKLKTRELNREKIKAEQATIQKTYFLANMSHELRTPLNAILGLSNMLVKTPLSNEQSSLLSKMQQASKSLLSLISDILDVSKIETGNIELEISPFSIRKLTSKIKDLFESQANLKNLAFKVEYQGNGSDWLVGDEHRLQQILFNLCSNALKFTETGGVTVRITNNRDTNQTNANTLLFEVIDTGIGIDENRVASIFKSFTQADASITRKYGGTGLGLAISKTLVELMDGQLQCRSQTGIGTQFWFELSFKSAVQQAVKTPQVPAEQQLKQILNGSMVLIAEDNEINQQIIAFHMESLGAELTLVENGLQAVNAVKQCTYDLILMDIQMPELDGIQASKQILQHENGMDVPIVALSANVSVEDKQACFDAGILAHIPKPFELSVLHSTLLNVLSNKL
ncbi:ATP-binding protein [Catenovulum sp. SX2]|uniref:ATP-binding protein n=1 Tax=Catenovulum sp. SX2 TaxID=3398614 RepID=UPI003F8742B1